MLQQFQWSGNNLYSWSLKWGVVYIWSAQNENRTVREVCVCFSAQKEEIWCVNFSDKYFAFPGSSVKSSMAAYMNMDFEKASRDFKGVFSISSGSSYSTEPAVLRRGGAGFVVERTGKLIFPN